jgi:hypothetical protein
MSHVDKLATVSKILLDGRVIELRQEVETLKLEIFWRDHSLFRLNNAMKIANGMHVKCWCGNCGLRGRTYLMSEAGLIDHDAECRFMPWFDGVLLSHGLVMLESSRDRGFRCHSVPTSIRPLSRDNDCMDYDCHLFKLDTHSASYAFGTKLWQAKSVNDPELQKLINLISMLEAYDDVE